MTFETKTVNGVQFLEAQGLGAVHGFSARLGGISEGVYSSLNLGLRRGDDDDGRVRENYRRFRGAIGASEGQLVLTNQVHGTVIRPVTAKDGKKDLLDPVGYEADGLTTDEKGLVLTVFTADCIPILLCDPVRGAVAALHAGWRGTAGNIGGQGVAALVDRYGCRPGHIRAAIGPGIGFCCFETGPEVPEAMEKVLDGRAGPFIRAGAAPGKFFVDLKGVNRALLIRAGVRAEQIAVADDCTYCQHDRYWSHRYTKGVRGSQAAMICLT